MATNPPPVEGGQSEQDERLWGMLAHLSALVGLILPPVGFILGPLVVWLVKKDVSGFVDDQGKESLNFQISMLIYAAVAFVLTYTIILALITIPLLLVISIFDIVEVILASIKARDGYRYRYPLTIRFVA